MTRDECKQKVIDIMIHKNPYGSYHQKNFNTYSSYGEIAPINSSIINNMPNAKIVLSEDIYDHLIAVQDITVTVNKEFPFFLYGKETSPNTIEFNEFISASNDRRNTSCSFNDAMKNSLQHKIDENLNNGLVVCYGHSHPPLGPFHQNFSLGDFVSLMSMNEDNPVFKNRQVELTGCLVTSTGDINFIFYDNQNQNFYRFTNVFVKDKNNNCKPIDCYGLHQSQHPSTRI